MKTFLIMMIVSLVLALVGVVLFKTEREGVGAVCLVGSYISFCVGCFLVEKEYLPLMVCVLIGLHPFVAAIALFAVGLKCDSGGGSFFAFLSGLVLLVVALAFVVVGAQETDRLRDGTTSQHSVVCDYGWELEPPY